MRRPRLVASVVSFVCVILLASPPSVEGAESTSSSVAVVAGFGTRTSLKVSSEVLQFAVSEPDAPAVAVIEFAAGARTQAGADPLVQVGATEPPLPSDPDCRQFTGLDQPVNRPRIHFQTAQHLFSGQEGGVGRLAARFHCPIDADWRRI
jgi:hypothetical protein